MPCPMELIISGQVVTAHRDQGCRGRHGQRVQGPDEAKTGGYKDPREASRVRPWALPEQSMDGVAVPRCRLGVTEW